MFNHADVPGGRKYCVLEAGRGKPSTVFARHREVRGSKRKDIIVFAENEKRNGQV
jgi:hypothetical protein